MRKSANHKRKARNDGAAVTPKPSSKAALLDLDSFNSLADMLASDHAGTRRPKAER